MVIKQFQNKVNILYGILSNVSLAFVMCFLGFFLILLIFKDFITSFGKSICSGKPMFCQLMFPFPYCVVPLPLCLAVSISLTQGTELYCLKKRCHGFVS